MLRTAADGWATLPALAATRVLLEPGRFISGPTGVYLTTVLATKRRAGTIIAVVDGGIHHLARPALLGQSNRVAVLGAAGRASVDSMITGPLCTGLDVLAAAAPLPEPCGGDVVAILDTGAYGFTESMPLFLSHPQPAEVGVRDGEARLIRPRIEPAEVLARQHLPW